MNSDAPECRGGRSGLPLVVAHRHEVRDGERGGETSGAADYRQSQALAEHQTQQAARLGAEGVDLRPGDRLRIVEAG